MTYLITGIFPDSDYPVPEAWHFSRFETAASFLATLEDKGFQFEEITYMDGSSLDSTERTVWDIARAREKAAHQSTAPLLKREQKAVEDVARIEKFIMYAEYLLLDREFSLSATARSGIQAALDRAKRHVLRAREDLASVERGMKAGHLQ